MGRQLRNKIIIFFLSSTFLTGCGIYDFAKCFSGKVDPTWKKDDSEISLEFPLPKSLEMFALEEDGSSIQHEYIVFPLDKNSRTNPPLLLLHELPGLTRKTLNFAHWLSEEGFTVYAPLLFGKLAEESKVKGFVQYFASQEWIPFVEKKISFQSQGKEDEDFVGKTRPIHHWLRKFVKMIQDDHSNQTIGVIGMCLTGASPLALLDNKNIQKVVVAQPTLPFMFWGTGYDYRSLGLSGLELSNAIKRVKIGGIKILGTRFLNDCLAKREKHEYMQAIFGKKFIDAELLDYVYSNGKVRAGEKTEENEAVPYRAHSTLVGDWQDYVSHPSEKLRSKIVSFFRKS